MFTAGFSGREFNLSAELLDFPGIYVTNLVWGEDYPMAYTYPAVGTDLIPPLGRITVYGLKAGRPFPYEIPVQPDRP